MISYKIFNLRDDSDFINYYPLVHKWWEEWRFTPIAPEMLSTKGIMIFSDNVPICAGWLYSTDSNTGLLGWIISTKEHKDKRHGCIDELLIQTEKLAQTLGFELLGVLGVSNPFLSDKVIKQGFGKYVDSNVKNHFKVI